MLVLYVVYLFVVVAVALASRLPPPPAVPAG